MTFVDAGVGETRDSVDGGADGCRSRRNQDSVDRGAGNKQGFMWMQVQEKPGILYMEEQETTNDLCGCRSRRNQGFCRWMSRRQPIIFMRMQEQEKTRDSADGGTGDNQ